MQLPWTRRLGVPLALAAAGATFTALTAVDKVVGLVQKPRDLATVAYLSLFGLTGWAFARGIQIQPSRLVRLSIYAATLILLLLTAAYVFAWQWSADPTPVMLQAQLRHGDALLEAGQKEDAYLVYRSAYRRFSRSFSTLMRMGTVSYRLTDYEKARRYFSRALEVAPPGSRWRALNDLGQSYWMLQRPEAAIDLYEQARRAGMPHSERIEWHYRLGWAHFDTGNYDAAIQHYRMVAEAGQKYAAASFYNIACALAQKITRASSPAERQILAHQAVASLRQAWAATTTEEETQALRKGLLGGRGELDPDLAPLQGYSGFTALLRELRRPGFSN